MIQLIYSEFLKMKRSAILFISLLGACVTPFVILSTILRRSWDPGLTVNLEAVLAQANTMILLLFGVVIYTVIGAFLFSREYSEQTLKTVLTIPISRPAFLTGKFSFMLIWIVILSVLTWLLLILLSLATGVEDVTPGAALGGLGDIVLGGLMIFGLSSPFIFLAMWRKEFVTPVIAVAAAAMVSVTIVNDSLAALYPWSIPFILLSGKLPDTGYAPGMSLGVMFATIMAGFAACYIYFIRRDAD